MEIERVNENTVKLYLSYVDIEERGYTKEELWTDREKGEQLFWEIMEEVDEEYDFQPEGPLWIQVATKMAGIEVTITKAAQNHEGNDDFPFNLESAPELFGTESDETFEHIEELLRNSVEEKASLEEANEPLLFAFPDFEELLQSVSRLVHYEVDTKLYVYKDVYYLQIHLDEEDSDEIRKNLYSVLTEFGRKPDQTVYQLAEYGKVIIERDVFHTMQTYFIE